MKEFKPVDVTQFKTALQQAIEALPKASYIYIEQFKRDVAQCKDSDVEKYYVEIEAAYNQVFEKESASEQEKLELTSIGKILFEYKTIDYCVKIKRDISAVISSAAKSQEASADPSKSINLSGIKNNILKELETKKGDFQYIYKILQDQLALAKVSSLDDEVIKKLNNILERYKDLSESFLQQSTVIKSQYDQLLQQLKSAIQKIVEKYSSFGSRLFIDAAVVELKRASEANNPATDLAGFIKILEEHVPKINKDRSILKDNSVITNIENLLQIVSRLKLAQILKSQSQHYEVALNSNMNIRNNIQQVISSKDTELEVLKKENLNLTQQNINLSMLQQSIHDLSMNTSLMTQVEKPKENTYEYEREKLSAWVNKECFELVDKLLKNISGNKKKIEEIKQSLLQGQNKHYKFVPEVSVEHLEKIIVSADLCIFNQLVDVTNRKQKETTPVIRYLTAIYQLYLTGLYLPKNPENAEIFKKQIQALKASETQAASDSSALNPKK